MFLGAWLVPLYFWSRSGRVEETPGEAIHRDLSHLARLSPNASVFHLNAMLKVEPNFQIYDHSCALNKKQLFHDFFVNYKAFAQMDDNKYNRLVPVKMKTEEFFNFVYRAGEECCRDFGKLAKTISQDKSSESVADKLKAEFLLAVMSEPQTMFTIPICDDPTIAETCDDMRGAAAIVEASVTDQFIGYRVLNANPKKKKFHGNMDDIWANLAVPMLVQSYLPWLATEYPMQQHNMSPHGEPQVLNVLSLATWPILQSCLRKWKVTGSPSFKKQYFFQTSYIAQVDL